MSDRFVTLAIASGAVALLALVIPWVLAPHIELSTLVRLLFLLPTGWAVMTVGGLFVYRKRGLWLLLGGPVALFNLIWFVATFNPCDPTGARCL